MFGCNHNHGNDTGNGNQSDHGEREEGRPERPGLLYGEKLHDIRAIPVLEGLRVDTTPRRDPDDWSRIVYKTRDSDTETEAGR